MIDVSYPNQVNSGDFELPFPEGTVVWDERSGQPSHWLIDALGRERDMSNRTLVRGLSYDELVSPSSNLPFLAVDSARWFLVGAVVLSTVACSALILGTVWLIRRKWSA